MKVFIINLRNHNSGFLIHFVDTIDKKVIKHKCLSQQYPSKPKTLPSEDKEIKFGP